MSAETRAAEVLAEHWEVDVDNGGDQTDFYCDGCKETLAVGSGVDLDALHRAHVAAALVAALRDDREGETVSHSIRWTFDRGAVTAEAVCNEAPGADCRLTSVTCECEEWGEIRRTGEPDNKIWHKIVGYGDSIEPLWHEVVPQDDCNVCLFINESGCVEELGGRVEFIIAETPIRPVWLGDGCDWEPVALDGGNPS